MDQNSGLVNSPSKSISNQTTNTNEAAIFAIEVLEQLESIVQFVQNNRCLRTAMSTEGWKIFCDGICNSLTTPLSYDPSKARTGQEECKRAWSLRRRLWRVDEQFGQLGGWSSSMFLECKDRMTSLALRSGLESIPDDVLTSILEFAVLSRTSKENRPGTKTFIAAVHISHVCSRFRKLVLSSSSFWSNVDNCMHPDEISVNASRSWAGNSNAKLNASLFVHIPPRNAPNRMKPIDKILSLVVENPSLCKRLEVVCKTSLSPILPPSIEAPEIGEYLGGLGALTHPIHLQRLSELLIAYPSKTIDFFVVTPEPDLPDKIHFYSSWRTPNLRSMLVKNFIPVPFGGASTISSLSVALHAIVDYASFRRNESYFTYTVENAKFLNIKRLVAFLSSCPQLEEVSLQLCGPPPFTPAPPETTVSLDRVRRISLDFGCCSAPVISAVFGVIHFPKISIMSVKIETEEAGRQVAPDQNAQSVIEALFPDKSRFGSVENMELKVQSLHGHSSAVESKSRVVVPILVPFSCWPKLRRLELSVHPIFPLRLIELEKAPFPPLEMLELGGSPKMGKPWVDSFIRSRSGKHPGLKVKIQLTDECLARWKSTS